ncbi:hypothetical protein [Streptomyces sp. NBC_00872]|uniref:hypothetical protein n=1 Tax=Streptomyces sp. NBC_00872 TaxID=2903686 RepID=UPI003870102F|nr:hypothetical protein OG214_22285 [Streptomyces sp. NBC_00872]
MLSHEEQRDRLAVSCPEAVPVSVVAGDPCFDQLRVSRPFRETYRHALGVRPGQKLIVVSSTWGQESVLASEDPATDVLRRALAELPADEYRVLAAIHPNAWYGHGGWQLQSWLAPLTDCGLLLPSPESETWKAALLAADGFFGDHGSLSMYSVALNVPTILGSFAESKIAPRSPMARLGELLPRLSQHRQVLPQLLEAVADQPDKVELQRLGGTVTSRPGESAALLRHLFYKWLDLPEPAIPASPRVVPVPPANPVRPLSPAAPPMYVSVVPVNGRATVARYPAAVQRRREERHLAGTHLVADINDPDSRWPGSADILLVPLGRSRSSRGPQGRPEAFARYPGCALLAVEEPEDGCLALLRNHLRLRVCWSGRRPWWASAAICASVVHDHVISGPDTHAPARVQVTIGQEAEPGLLDIFPA